MRTRICDRARKFRPRCSPAPTRESSDETARLHHGTCRLWPVVTRAQPLGLPKAAVFRLLHPKAHPLSHSSTMPVIGFLQSGSLAVTAHTRAAVGHVSAPAPEIVRSFRKPPLVALWLGCPIGARRVAAELMASA